MKLSIALTLPISILMCSHTAFAQESSGERNGNQMRDSRVEEDDSTDKNVQPRGRGRNRHRNVNNQRDAERSGRRVRQRGADGNNERRGRQGREPGGQGGGGAIFRLLDVDRDEKLSSKEIEGAVAVLMKLDANKDGELDSTELNVRGNRADRQADGGQRRGGQRRVEGEERRRAQDRRQSEGRNLRGQRPDQQ